MQEIRDAVKEKLEELNEYPFKRREGNRNTAYLEEEMSFMKPLPLTPYEPAVWSTAVSYTHLDVYKRQTYQRVIVDYAHAYFEKPIEGIDSIYTLSLIHI